MPTSSSLRITGAIALATPSDSTNFFASQPIASMLATIKLNSSVPLNQYLYLLAAGVAGPNVYASFIQPWTTANQLFLCNNLGANGALGYALNVLPGGTYSIAATWNAGNLSSIWVNDYNGTPVFSTTAAAGTYAANYQLILGQFYNAGMTAWGDYQIQDLAISPSYALTAADVLAYRNQAKTPLQIDASFSWWPLGGGTIGATPTLSDAGLQDQNARAVNFNSLLGGSLSNAVYAAPIAYVAPTTVVPQVTKSGKLTMFVAVDTGSQIPRQVTAVASNPTINVQFGGVGSPEAIATWGPVTSIGSSLPHRDAFAAYQNICGPVESIVVQKGGANYSSSPSASISGGGGSGCTLGTPVVTQGVTAYTFTAGSGYNYTPAVTVTGGAGTGALPAITMSGGAISAVGVFWPGHGYTGLPTITLSIPPNTASPTGSGAAVVASALSNVVRSIPVTSYGSGYTSVPTITITDGTGSGAVAVPIMGGVQPGDVVTYGGVADAWLLTTSGIAGAVATTAPVVNSSGQLEPGAGTATGFNEQPAGTFGCGFNTSANQPSFASSNGCNWRRLTSPNGASWDMGGNPLMTAATAGSPVIMVVAYSSTSNGVFTFVADELTPSTPMSIGAQVQSGNASVSVSQVSAGTSTTGVTSITLSTGGSGYTDRPRITFSGGGGSGATAYAKINSAGAVIGLYLLSPGTGYTSAPSVVITPADGNGSGAAGTATHGAILSGVAWQATVSGAAPATGLASLQFTAWNPNLSGNYAWTLQNVFIFSPEETALWSPSLPPRSNGLRADGGMKKWLVSAAGNGPSTLRFMGELGYGLSPGCVEAEDIRDANDWQYQLNRNLSPSDLALRPTGQRTFKIDQVRTWRTDSSQTFPSGWGVTWTSPNVYHNFPQFGSVNGTFTGYGTGADTSGPYVTNLTGIGSNQSLLVYNLGGGGGIYVGEFHTTTPHNFKTGQSIVVDNTYTNTGSWQIATDNVGGTATAYAASTGFLYGVVTGPQTIAFITFQPSTFSPSPSFPGGTYNVAGEFSVDMQLVAGYPWAGYLPVEAAAGVAATFPGCVFYLNVPYNATDLCAASIFRRVRDIMPLGSQTYLEHGNELWNLGGQPWGGWFTWTLGQLRGQGYITSDEAGAIRLAEIAAIGRAVYNETDINGNTNRGGELKTIIGGQFGSDWPLAQVTYFNSINAPLAAVCVADYESTNQQDSFTAGGINVCTAFASLASHWPSSTAYLFAHPWSRAACIDWYRYQMKYDQETHDPQIGWFAITNEILAGYAGPSSSPKQIDYEGGVDAMCPLAVQNAIDPDGGTLYWRLNGDLSYDPAAADAVYAWCQSQQDGGCSLGNIVTLCLGTFYVFEDWTCAAWRGQPVGLGDGSVASDGNSYTNKFWTDDQLLHDFGNVTPKLVGYQRWQDGISGAPATSATLFGPAIGTVGVATGTFTVTLNGLYTGTVTPAVSGVTGTLSPTSLVWSGTSGAKTFTLTATSAGTASVSITASPTLTIAGSPISVTVSTSATTATLSGPATATEAVATSAFTVALNGVYTGTITPTVSGVTGSFTPISLSWSGTSGSKTFTFTPSSSGTASISITASPTLSYSGSPVSVSVSPGAVDTLSVTGPSSATAGMPLSITVTADLTMGGTDTSYRGTIAFTSNDPHAALPGNYTFTVGDVGVHSFTVTFLTAGDKTITATDTVTSAISGTSAAVSVSPATPSSLSARAVSTSQINLSWMAAAGATGYQIQESATGTGGWTTVGTVGSGSTTSFGVTGLTNMTQYFFRLYATGGGFDSLDSNVASATTGPLSGAAAPRRWFSGLRRPAPVPRA